MEILQPRIEDLPVKERLLLAYLLRHIKNKQVCPTNAVLKDNGYVSGLVPVLAKKGLIRIELNQENLRVITSCVGKLAGHSTQKPVEDWKTVTVIDYDVAYKKTFGTPSLARRPPWET
jgi:hypothetical protein